MDLSQRTLTKWKQGKTKPSTSAIALCKYLRKYPWSLKVADTGFDAEAAQKIHLEIAAGEMMACLPREKLGELYRREAPGPKP